MAGEGEELLPVIRIPDGDAAVAVAAGEERAVGTEGDGIDPVGMFLLLVLKLSCLSGINLQQASGASESDLALIGPDVGGKDGVIFIADRHQPFACHYVPYQHPPRLAAMSAPGSHQCAAAAERD